MMETANKTFPCGLFIDLTAQQCKRSQDLFRSDLNNLNFEHATFYFCKKNYFTLLYFKYYDICAINVHTPIDLLYTTRKTMKNILTKTCK